MNNSTLAGLNLPQWPTSVEDIHICYLQYTIHNTSTYYSNNVLESLSFLLMIRL